MEARRSCEIFVLKTATELPAVLVSDPISSLNLCLLQRVGGLNPMTRDHRTEPSLWSLF